MTIGAATTWTLLGKTIDGHTCAGRSDRTLWCWGMNLQGEFGIGTMGVVNASPTQVASNVVAFGSGWSHRCTIGTDTRVRCSGSDEHLEGGWTASVTAPAQVGASAWAGGLPLRWADDYDAAATYTETWTGWPGAPGYAGDSVHYSNTPGDSMTFAFTGTRIRWIGAKNLDHDRADVRICDAAGANCGSPTTVDTYDPSYLKQQVL